MTASAPQPPALVQDLSSRLAAAGPLVQQDSVEAAEVLRAIVADAAEAGERGIEAEAAYLWARAEVNNGRLDPALELIDRARRQWEAEGDRLSAWRTDLGRMHVLDDLGRHAEALRVGTALIALVDDADLNDADAEQGMWLRAAASENVGVGHGYMGDHQRALDAYAAAEATYRELGWTEDVPRPMANRGVELLEIGRHQEAVAVLAEAAAGFAANDDDLFTAKCLAYKAKGHVSLGDHLAAAAATSQAERHLSGLTASTEYARTQLVRAETLRWLNLFDEAVDLYTSMIGQFAEAGLRHDLADAHYGHGLALAALGSPDEASASLRSAEDVFAEVGAAPQRAAAMVARAELADAKDARALCENALPLLEGSGRVSDVVAARLRLSEVARDGDEATRHLSEAAALLRDHPTPELEWRVALARGRRHRTVGDNAAARRSFNDALAIVDGMRGSLAGEHHRLLFMSTRDAVIDELVTLELDDGHVGAAHAHAERARARTLVERLTGELAAAATAEEPELDVIYDTLLQTPVRGAANLLDRARSLERSTLTPSTGLSHAESSIVHAGASPADAVLTYHRLGDELMAFADVGGEVTAVRGLASIAEVQALLKQLEAQWRRFDDPGLAARQHAHLLAATVDILQQLYVRLLAPLPDIDRLSSAAFVPCAPLGNVPFGALHDGTSYLLERLTLSYLPSGRAGRQQPWRRNKRLVLGVPDENIPNVMSEVEAIGRIASESIVISGGDATRRALKRLAPDADVIHLACHGVDRPDSPMFSALKLGDGWLTAAGVAELDLNGQVVILSACSSGRQFRHGGSELVGLPRAFLAAGASDVIVNLWRVSDSSAELLMTQFHEHLQSLDPAAALRAAQLTVMSEHPHPYHWGPAVLYGSVNKKESS